MGISYRQLNHWCAEGYLQPVEPPNGGRREWPDVEIRIGRMMSRLVAVGITPARAAYYARKAVVDKTPMLLEFRGGKLIVSGPFARAVRISLARRKVEYESQSYRSA